MFSINLQNKQKLIKIDKVETYLASVFNYR